jgi:phage gpG-like protein
MGPDQRRPDQEPENLMPLTVIQLPGYLRKIADDLKAEAPIRAVHAMGEAYTIVVVRSMKGDAPSPPGTPPARRTGTLARSIRQTAAERTSATTATCKVMPHTVYARIQQFGGDIYPRHTLHTDSRLRGSRRGEEVPYGPVRQSDLGFLRWESGGEVHFGRHVHLPARPYMVMSPEARSRCHDAAAQAVQALLKSAE